MNIDDKEFEVEVEDGFDAAAEPELEVVTEEEEKPQRQEDEEKKRLSHSQRLKIQRDRERSARQELEKEAAELRQHIARLSQRETEAVKLGTEQQLRSVDAQMADVKARLVVAIDNGNSVDAAELQIRAAELAAEARALKVRQGNIRPQEAPRAQQPTPQQPPQQPQLDTTNFNRWHARNPQFGVDPEFTARAKALHNVVIDDGYEEGTPEYFEAIDRELANTPQRRVPSPPPSPGRSTRQSNSIRVKLTAEEQETARSMGVTLEQYAKRKLLLQKADSRGYVEV
jgi:hypothetical protein